MSDLAKAIKFLKPTAEFSFYNDDYSTIKWDVLDGAAPTQAELNDAIEQVKINEIAEAEAKATARQAILDRLGLTADEAALLLG
jgi:hypothetical protein